MVARHLQSSYFNGYYFYHITEQVTVYTKVFNIILQIKKFRSFSLNPFFKSKVWNGGIDKFYWFPIHQIYVDIELKLNILYSVGQIENYIFV